MAIQKLNTNEVRVRNTTLTVMVDSGASGYHLDINFCPRLKEFIESLLDA